MIVNRIVKARCVLQRLLSAAIAAFASVSPGHVTAAIGTGDNAELMLVIWDPVREASYTQDLGVSLNSFFAAGQQDAGYQSFLTLDATDPRFQQFRNLGTAAGGLLWSVLGFDVETTGAPGEQRTFLTLQQGTAAGAVNPNYTALLRWSGIDWDAANNNFALNLPTQLNNNVESNPYNSHSLGGAGNFSANGSSFTVKGQLGYFDVGGQPTFNDTLRTSVMNPVGKSSWFYSVTTSSFDTNLPVSVDEFDNLSADGYWGLAQDPASSNFVLSYTLPPALAANLAVTNAGRARASLTELRSGSLSRLISAPAGEFADWCPPVISAVPEPAAWWSLAAGGAVLWLLRRRVHSGANLSTG